MVGGVWGQAQHNVPGAHGKRGTGERPQGSSWSSWQKRGPPCLPTLRTQPGRGLTLVLGVSMKGWVQTGFLPGGGGEASGWHRDNAILGTDPTGSSKAAGGVRLRLAGRVRWCPGMVGSLGYKPTVHLVWKQHKQQTDEEGPETVLAGSDGTT